jgi:hypothetical protein
MKTLWNILAVVAVANLFALIGIVGYLKLSDRLDATRIREVRQLFSITTKDRKAQEEEAKTKAELDARVAKEEAKKGTPPVNASDTLDLKIQQSQIDLARMESLKREVQILQETLGRAKAKLDSDRDALEKERKDFEQAREVVRKTETDVQFKKALATLEGLKPDKAKATLQTLIDEKQVDQVVSYLNAMQERSRTKVMDEFIKSDPKVATDLLERLRTRGISVAGVGGP